jgi:hypothetical protein
MLVSELLKAAKSGTFSAPFFVSENRSFGACERLTESSTFRAYFINTESAFFSGSEMEFETGLLGIFVDLKSKMKLAFSGRLSVN